MDLTTNNLVDSSWLDAYPIDRVCLAKTTAAATGFIKMHGQTSDAPDVEGFYQYKQSSDTYGVPQHVLKDGASKWQRHGCDPVELDWGLEVDGKGAVVYEEVAGVGTRFRIWVMEKADCTLRCLPGGDFCDPMTEGSTVVTGAKGLWDPEDYLIRTEVAAADAGLPSRVLFAGERFRFDTSAP